MRGQDHSGLKRFRLSLAGALLGGMLVFVCGAIYAQTAPQIVPRVTPSARAASSAGTSSITHIT
jgi:nitrate reductase (cytochrome), electron transfer subunit